MRFFITVLSLFLFAGCNQKDPVEESPQDLDRMAQADQDEQVIR